MKTAEEILTIVQNEYNWLESYSKMSDTTKHVIRKAMKDYAIEACEQQRMICSEYSNKVRDANLEDEILNSPEPDLI